MRTGDLLYFAPHVRFDQVDLDGADLPDQFQRRVEGFYIRPAAECAQAGFAFAAGVLLVSCIDALARLRFGDGVAERFKKFTREELSSFADGGLAKRFYEEFRNGLVHAARLKRGGQFSLETTTTVKQLDGLLLITPRLLAEEVREALSAYCKLLDTDNQQRVRLAESLRRDHTVDFRVAKA